MSLNKKTVGIIVAAIACVCIAGALAFSLAGPKAQSADTAASPWTATQDDDLNVLSMQVAGGAVVAMPGDGWAARDGFIQLQLSGGSIPGQTIDSVTQDGEKLAVTLKSGDEPTSLDLVLTEFRLEGGDVASVKAVSVTYANGETADLEAAYE